MNFFRKLFGGGDTAPAEPMRGEPQSYKSFTITPMPMPEGGQFRLSALIEKDVAGEVKSHRLIRADLFPVREDADAAALLKAKRMIDEQSEVLFD